MKFTARNLSSLVFSGPSSRILGEIYSNSMMVKWSKENPTTNIFEERFELHEYIHDKIICGKQIDYLEFGVFKGNSIKKWAEMNQHEASRFFGFDSFEGLPEQWESAKIARPNGTFDVGGNVPEVDDNRIQFIKGWFQDTLGDFLKSFDPKSRLVIHNDSDIYSSTLYCLTKLDDIIKLGSIIVFDEFYSSSNEFRAFMDYTRSYNRTYSVLGAVGSNPYVQLALEMK